MVNAPLVTAIPTVGADELASDVITAAAAGAGQERRIQAALVTLIGRPSRPPAEMAGHAVLAVRPARVNPCLVPTKTTGAFGLVASTQVPTPVAVDVDRDPAVPQASVARAKTAALGLDGVVRHLELPRALVGPRPKRAEAWASAP